MSKWMLFAYVGCLVIAAINSSPILNKHEKKSEIIAKQSNEITGSISTTTSAVNVAISSAAPQASTASSEDDDDDDDDEDLDLTEDDDDDDEDDYDLDRILDDIFGG